MNLRNARVIYFSPTGTSKRVVQAIAEGFEGVDSSNEIDLTRPGFSPGPRLGIDDLAVIGVPVYAGRVPEIAARRLKEMSGSGTPVVIVAVYGNREFEDALVELRDIVVAQGFEVVAAGAFIGEHSFSTDELPIAAGRPDSEDLKKAREFGRSIIRSLASLEEGGKIEIHIPGNVPYRDGMENLPFTPVVDHTICTECETCVENCPVGAITLDDQIVMDSETCIFCASCVKGCPERAVSFNSTPIADELAELSEKCSARKEPQLFL
jgi:ferredoxin